MTAQIEGELSKTLPTVMCPTFTCTRDARCLGGGGGGGGVPYKGVYGEVTPKRGTFFRLRGL